MDSVSKWSRLFNNWPETLPRKGLITTNLNEVIPFKGFLYADDMLVLERTTPDASGCRFIILGYESIDSVRMLDALKESAFSSLGLSGKFAR